MEKIEALNLAKDCYSMRLDLLTNATVVDDAIRFVHSNRNISILDHSRLEIGEGRNEAQRKELSIFSPEDKGAEVTVNKIF
jgi:hypothetical protein